MKLPLSALNALSHVLAASGWSNMSGLCAEGLSPLEEWVHENTTAGEVT